MEIVVMGMTSQPEHPGVAKLKKSLDRYGYNYDILHEVTAWGQQQPVVLDWCKKNAGKYSHFIYTDTWDIVFLGSLDEIKEKLPPVKFLGSVEKACFPVPELADQYPPEKYEWKFINAGSWFCEIEQYIKWQEQNPSVDVNDQTWLHLRFLESLKNNEPVAIDTGCQIFQSIAFEHSGDFTTYAKTTIKDGLPFVQQLPSARKKEHGGIINLQTKTLPVIIHGNGRTEMDWVYELAGV